MLGQVEPCPKVMSSRNLARAVALHVAVVVLFLIFSIPLRRRAEIIPIDLTVVVAENLDGNEEEPPPMEKPVARPAPPPVEVKPPPVVEESKVEALIKEPTKPKPKPQPPAEKPKTREQLREERRKEMLKEAKIVKDSGKRQPDGKTDKAKLSREEALKLLNQGYRAGKSDNLAADEEQRCISLIQQAFYSKWERPPWSSSLKEMLLDVNFDSAGHVTGFKLTQRSGEAAADRSVLEAAAKVSIVHGLSSGFLKKYPTVTIRFKVTAQ